MTPKKAKARAVRPKVMLVMIVRDEAAILRERLKAIHDEVDGWCIVDTGSTDETRAIVSEVMDDLPGEANQIEWAGFADARTFAIRSAEAWAVEQGEEWWALLLDADTVFHVKPGWRRALSERVDVVDCEVHHGALRYTHPRLLRLGSFEWRWRGVLHEYLAVPAGARRAETDLLWVEHGSGGARSKDPERYRKDAFLLHDVRVVGAEPDLDARYAFYEAQSWRDAGEPDAAVAVYLERAEMGGWDQEVYVSLLRAGELMWGRPHDQGLEGPQTAVELWLRAWSVDPSRAEALIGLATIMRERQWWAPAYTFAAEAYKVAGSSAGLFADVNVGWRADFEVSVAGWYVGKRQGGMEACERVLESDLAPEAVKERTRSNLALYRGAT